MRGFSVISPLGAAILVVAFTVLVWTFLWMARLMARRAQMRQAPAPSPAVDQEVAAGPTRIRGRGYGANYGLMLGLVACGAFFVWPSPLLLAVAVVGLFYSGRSLVRGLRYFRVIVWRALLGVLLNAALPLMLFLYDTGRWPLPMLDAGLGLV